MTVPAARRLPHLGVSALLLFGAPADPPARPPPTVVIAAVFADGYAPADLDEAVQIWNVGEGPIDLAGWALGDRDGSAAFPASAVLDPGAVIGPGEWRWLARDAEAFARSFGHHPDWTWGTGSGSVGPSPPGTVPPRLVTLGGGPTLANVGDTLFLRSPDGRDVDAVVYGRGAAAPGWVGPPVTPYHPPTIGTAHQVLYRKLDPDGDRGRLVADTDRAVDWASDPGDVALGRRIRFPGWDIEAAVRPQRARDAASIEVAVAPDALFVFLRRHVTSARTSIDVLTYTLEHPALAEALAERALAGVRVRVLVEGRPAGGIDLDQRWGLARIAAAGGEVYWMDAGGDVGPRYRAAHAKVVVIDGRTVLIGSENLSPGAAPDDDFGDGTLGRRGVYVATDAPSVIAWAGDLVARDLDPEHHVDLRPFQARDPDRGAPAPDYLPDRASGGAGYAPIAPEPLVARGSFDFEWVTAPENALIPAAGLLGLLARAGDGDEVLAQQLDEPAWWGDGPAEGVVARSPRVQAYIAAARRGARVRLLLDGFFDDPAHWNSNAATVAYIEAVRNAEGLDIQARIGNPAGLGLHNKMVLVRLITDGYPTIHWSHIGSLNGSESASKANREAALQIESGAVHRYLARVFAWDWAASGANAVWLPWAGG